MTTNRLILALLCVCGIFACAPITASQQDCITVSQVERTNKRVFVGRVAHVNGFNAQVLIALDPYWSGSEIQRLHNPNVVGVDQSEKQFVQLMEQIDEVIIWEFKRSGLAAAIAFKDGCAVSGYGGPDHLEKLTIKDPSNLHYVTQTTLSVDETKDIIKAMKSRWPAVTSPKNEDICYATQNRQDAVRGLAEICQLLLVVGSVTSSNSNRLRELAEHCGAQAYLIDDASEIDAKWLEGVLRVGVTAGASAPEILVSQVIERLKTLGGKELAETGGTKESIVFVLPAELR